MTIWLLDQYNAISEDEKVIMQREAWDNFTMKGNNLMQWKKDFIEHVEKMINKPTAIEQELKFRKPIQDHPDLKMFFDRYHELLKVKCFWTF